MDSGNESSGSSAGHHAGGNPTSLLESRKGRGTHKQVLFGSVRFGAYSTEMILGEVGRAPTIQFTGERSAYNVVDEAS